VAGDDRNDQRQWWYLRVAVDERIFNEDPEFVHDWPGDPQYIPLYDSTSYFFKCLGVETARKIVRLLDKSVKPLVETDGERRVRVDFSCVRSSQLDEDEHFLADDAIEEIRKNVERQHTEWRVSQGLRFRGNVISSGRELLYLRPPLSNDLLDDDHLYDQAQRWCDRIGGEQQTSKAVILDGASYSDGEVTQLSHRAASSSPIGSEDRHDLSETKLLILRGLLEMGATKESKKITCPMIAKKTKMGAGTRLRNELAALRDLNLLGGAKRTIGYWLTDDGIREAKTSSSAT